MLSCNDPLKVSYFRNDHDVIFEYSNDDDWEFALIKDGTTLTGIGKDFILSCNEIFIESAKINSSLLGLLKIKKLELLYTSVGVFEVNRKLHNAILIINKYLGSKDILACQEELIEAGYKEYARL